MRAPALPIAAKARSKAPATAGSRPSSIMVCGTANRRASSGNAGSSHEASPARTASSTAQHCTLRRERADGIERARERERPLRRYAVRGGLEADDAAQRRRNAAGAAGVGAERAQGHAVGDRHRSPRRRASRDACRLAVIGIRGRAMVRIDPEPGEGELGHVGAADRNEAGRPQARHGGRIARRRRRAAQHQRAGRGDLARDIEQVLDRDRNAGEARAGAERARAVVKICCGTRGLRVDLEESAPTLSRAVLDARQAILHQVAGFVAGLETCCGSHDIGHGASLGIRQNCILRSPSHSSFDLHRPPARFAAADRRHLPWSTRIASPLSFVACQVHHTTANQRTDLPGGDRRLDRPRSGRGREAHQGTGSLGRAAAGNHADLLSRLGRAADHRGQHRGGGRGLRRRGRVRAAAA